MYTSPGLKNIFHNPFRMKFYEHELPRNQREQRRLDERSGLHYEANGMKRWFLGGRLHRVEGPAVEMPDGTKIWWLHGKLHRDGGPAIERPDGNNEWWKHGTQITPQITPPGAFEN